MKEIKAELEFEYYSIEIDSKDDIHEINKHLWNISQKQEELVNVTVHPTRKTIILFIKSPH